MKQHAVRTYKSEEQLPREEQLAYKFARLATDPVEVDADVTDMIINRVIDNAAVAAASLTRAPVVSARSQALDHPVSRHGDGATVFGEALGTRTSPEWAAWANGVAVRELDYHDTFLAADYSHPGDNIPAIVAVAQHLGVRRGHDQERPGRPRFGGDAQGAGLVAHAGGAVEDQARRPGGVQPAAIGQLEDARSGDRLAGARGRPTCPRPSG